MTRVVQPKQPPKQKRPVKWCGGGHRQTQRWKAEDGCVQCEVARLRSSDAAEERRRWETELGPPPAELVIRDRTGAIVSRTTLARRRRRR